jgi:hypothetical protein
MYLPKKIIFATFLTTLIFVFGVLSFPASDILAAGITIPPGTGLPDPADTTGQGPVVQVAVTVMKWLLSIFTLLAVISFVYTGIKFLTSMGDTYKADEARKSLVYSIIGVAVVGGALILVYTVDALLQ